MIVIWLHCFWTSASETFSEIEIFNVMAVTLVIFLPASISFTCESNVSGLMSYWWVPLASQSLLEARSGRKKERKWELTLAANWANTDTACAKIYRSTSWVFTRGFLPCSSQWLSNHSAWSGWVPWSLCINMGDCLLFYDLHNSFHWSMFYIGKTNIFIKSHKFSCNQNPRKVFTWLLTSCNRTTSYLPLAISSPIAAIRSFLNSHGK